MPRGNTSTTYGSVAKTFHWLTALLILAMIPLGIIANDIAHQVRAPGASPTDEEIARATFLFSLHKTTGVAIFFLALARILWALSQPRPGLLNGDRWAEARLAETVHWLLYGSLVAVPLSGWLHHAATTGFAPIWWPFGQSLPFVPKDEGLAEVTATLHYILQWVLTGAVGLHIAGALKHHVIDGDATLRRMLPGRISARPSAEQPGHALPVAAALTVWIAAIGGGAALGWFGHALAPAAEAAQTPDATAAAQTESTGNWQVENGTLSISVLQMGSEVKGSFANWSADITYDETPDESGRHGSVAVAIPIRSLSLGSVTDQAMGPDYFHADEHPQATFEADILLDGGGHLARGTLTIKGQSVPVEMPFTLSIESDTATASGALTIDRRDFNIATGTKDEKALAFPVDIRFDLTAQRAE